MSSQYRLTIGLATDCNTDDDDIIWNLVRKIQLVVLDDKNVRTQYNELLRSGEPYPIDRKCWEKIQERRRAEERMILQRDLDEAMKEVNLIKEKLAKLGSSPSSV